jgi:hypothetical protein
MEFISFKTPSGTIFQIKKSDLESFSDSYLTIAALGTFKGDHINSQVSVSFPDKAMEHISYFYESKKWKNSHVYGNQWEIPEVSEAISSIYGTVATFEDFCDFLLLPFDEEELEEEEISMWDGMGYTEEELEEIKEEYRIEQHLEEEERLREELEEYWEWVYDEMARDYHDYY